MKSVEILIPSFLRPLGELCSCSHLILSNIQAQQMNNLPLNIKGLAATKVLENWHRKGISSYSVTIAYVT